RSSREQVNRGCDARSACKDAIPGDEKVITGSRFGPLHPVRIILPLIGTGAVFESSAIDVNHGLDTVIATRRDHPLHRLDQAIMDIEVTAQICPPLWLVSQLHRARSLFCTRKHPD